MVYISMLEEEQALGNYFNCKRSSLKVTSDQRNKVILVMKKLNDAMGYKLETLFKAVSVVDRYLIHLSLLRRKAPCLVTVGFTCLMIGAKLE